MATERKLICSSRGGGRILGLTPRRRPPKSHKLCCIHGWYCWELSCPLGNFDLGQRCDSDHPQPSNSLSGGSGQYYTSLCRIGEAEFSSAPANGWHGLQESWGTAAAAATGCVLQRGRKDYWTDSGNIEVRLQKKKEPWCVEVFWLGVLSRAFQGLCGVRRKLPWLGAWRLRRRLSAINSGRSIRTESWWSCRKLWTLRGRECRWGRASGLRLLNFTRLTKVTDKMFNMKGMKANPHFLSWFSSCLIFPMVISLCQYWDFGLKVWKNFPNNFLYLSRQW